MVGGLGQAGASASAAASPHWLFGCDDSPGIVSVVADEHGRARVWSRVEGGVVVSEHRFANWFLISDAALLEHMPLRVLHMDHLCAARDHLPVDEDLAVVELQHGDQDAYRFLVLTNSLRDVETMLLETYNKRWGGQAGNLDDLRGLVLSWPPVEQFLLATGRGFFKGMEFNDLHRFQFDLETSGLDEERDRIFLISMRDSRGWQSSLDTREMTEAALIERFVSIVNERDPDVLENHNIFAFDLPFLVRRSAALGVPLRLGRDGSEPRQVRDVFDIGDRREPFLRWQVVGREVIDTQHAVRRFGTSAPDMRRHGLKEAARYFGFAREDREYVPGPEIWATFRTDPERVRRYAEADVEEVDGLARRLLRVPFGLAKLVPRPYERIASDMSPLALWEPIMVRAYLHEARAIPAVTPRLQRWGGAGPRADLHVRGVFSNGLKLSLSHLSASVLVEQQVRTGTDELSAMPSLLTALLGRAAEHRGRAEAGLVPEATARYTAAALSLERLADAAPGYIGGHGLFSDQQAAARAEERVGQILSTLHDELRRRGATVIGTDGDDMLISAPDGWTTATEHEVAVAAQRCLPAGARVAYTGRYRTLYARAARSYITIGHDGSVTLDGPTFRPGRLERFGETFLREAAPLALGGDAIALRRLYLDAVARFRTHQVQPEEVCAQVALHRTPTEYRRSGSREEPYEVLIDSGVRTWRVGQRVRYFRGHTGGPRLLVEGDQIPPAEVDVEYYIHRLTSLYCQQFAQAFRREDFVRIFRLPGTVDDLDEESLAAIRVVGAGARA